VSHCARCGLGEDEPHDDCAARLRLEPPRFCTQCGRRLVVKVTPLSWTATCSRHGDTVPA
jgi:hypothetical protein